MILAAVARAGRRGYACHAGIYDGRRLRVPVRHWSIGTHEEIQSVDVRLDLVGTTALVSIEQYRYDGGEDGDFTRRLQLLSLGSWKPRTIVTAFDDGGNAVTLERPAPGSDGVYAIASCGLPTAEDRIVATLRWAPTGGAPQALAEAPFARPQDVLPTAAGLVVEGEQGVAILRQAPAFVPFAWPDDPECAWGPQVPVMGGG